MLRADQVDPDERVEILPAGRAQGFEITKISGIRKDAVQRSLMIEKGLEIGGDLLWLSHVAGLNERSAAECPDVIRNRSKRGRAAPP